MDAVDSLTLELWGLERLLNVNELAAYLRVPVSTLGHPTLFENGTFCVLLSESNRSWLDSASQRLNQALTKAAFDAGAYVTYESPQYRFSGHNVCAENNALRRLVLTTTRVMRERGSSRRMRRDSGYQLSLFIRTSSELISTRRQRTVPL